MKTIRSLRAPSNLLAAVSCAALIIAFPALGKSQDEQAARAVTEPMLLCAPDEASLLPGETTTVRTVVSPARKERLTYHWSATAGSITGRGTDAQWSFDDVNPGLYTATLRIRDQKGNERGCLVRVAVNEPTGERGSKTGGHLLVEGKGEEPGYGLYSYVLFGSKPAAEELSRFTETIKAYLSLMPAIVGLEKYVKERKELNIAYLPVLKENPEKADDPMEKLTPQWVLANYNLAMASVILGKIEGNYRNGPYIVAFPSPPLKGGTTPRPYLTMDLSKVPPKLIRPWIKEFLNQAAQERYWEPRRMPRFVLTLRTAIEVVSGGLDETKKAVNEWVTLVK